MSKKKIWLTAGLLSLLGTAQAESFLGMDLSALNSDVGLSNGMKMYMGASLGRSSQGDVCSTPFFDGDCDETDVSWKVLGGMRFNPMFGAELAYVDQGKAKLKGDVNGQSVSGESHITGYQLAGMGYVPVAPESAPGLEAFGRAGVMFWEQDSKTTDAEGRKTDQGDGVSVVLGVGAQYQFHQNMYLRGEWEHTFNAGADSQYETDTDQYSVGITYSTL